MIHLYILTLFVTLAALHITNLILTAHHKPNCYPGPLELQPENNKHLCGSFGKYKCAPGYVTTQNYTDNVTEDAPGNYKNDIQVICRHQQFCCQ